tara:strand:+ start:3452 stop:6784 length:3333 start_codon:yes stop_codon:yes gene_type:complete
MPKYLSGRVKRTPQNKLSDDRYQYLGLEQAEPNIGDPPTASGTPGIPAGVQYQMVSVLSNPGERYWKPVGGGLIPGAISVYDEGSLVGSVSSITQLDFVGNSIAANAIALGIAATITVSPPGNNGSVLYKDSGDFATSSNLIFNGTVGILTVGKGVEVGDTGLKVGVGGTFVTVSPSTGLVGINETNPTQELDVNGSVRIRETIYDYNNDAGSLNDILTKGSSGLEWTSNNAIRSGAGGTIYDVQYHNTAGLTDGAPNFVYRSDTSRVGIGSTQPSALLDVVGISKLRGGVFIDEPYVTGVSTFTGQIKADGGIVANTAMVSDLTETRVVFSGPSGELVDDADFSYNATSDTLDLTNVVISGQTEAKDLKATGISTLGNVKVDTNTVTTTSGALTLNASSGSIQSNAGIFVNVTTDSTSKDSGALTVDGGLGVEKNVNIGAKLSVVGVTTLASAGGITTTGGDLYVGNDLFIKGNFAIEEGNFQRLIVNPGVSTFKGDVEFFSDYVGAAKSAYWDESTNSLNLVSGTELNLGTSNELKVYHNGYTGDSYITESGSGNLYIQSSSNMQFENAGGTKAFATFNDNKSVDLYYNNSKKFSSAGTGATVYGQLDAEDAVLTSNLTVAGTSNLNGTVNLGDALTDNIIFGGKVNSTVLPNTDGNFDLGSDTLRWRTIYADTFDGITNLTLEGLVVTGIATFKDDVEFWGNTGVAKSAYWDKSDNNFKFVDNSKLIFGDGSDLEVSSDGLRGQIVSDNLNIRSKTSSKSYLLGSVGYGVSLYYDGNKKFETFDKGIGIPGSGSVGGGVSFHNSDNTYSTKIKALDSLAASYTLTLPPDDGSVGQLLKTDGNGNLDWMNQGAVNGAAGGDNTEVQYNDNGSFDGMDNFTYNKTTGDITISGASYNVTWDKSDNALEFQDDAKAIFGTGGDLEIYYTEGDGSNGGSVFKHTGDHDMRFQIPSGSHDVVFERSGDGANLAVYNADGAVELHWRGGSNPGKKFATTTSGIDITGGIQDKDGDLGTSGQILSSTGTELDWVDAADLSIVTIDVKQDNYCGVDDSALNPITITPTSVGVSTVIVDDSSNAYGRKYVGSNDPTSVAGGSHTVCDGDIWYDTTS